MILCVNFVDNFSLFQAQLFKSLLINIYTILNITSSWMLKVIKYASMNFSIFKKVVKEVKTKTAHVKLNLENLALCCVSILSAQFSRSLARQNRIKP